MYIESHHLFVAACVIFAIGYAIGQSGATKALKLRITKALDQHDVDVAHGYKEGYSGRGIVSIIRDIL